MGEQWKTSITNITEGKVLVRGYNVIDMMDKLTFSEVIFLLLKGELPNQKEKTMMEAILVSSIDHGVKPPSVMAARTVLSGGNSLNASVAAGVMTIGDSHGGAIEQCAKILQEYAEKDTPENSAKKILEDLKSQNKRMPGYGHRLYKDRDPRSAKLFEIADKIGYTGKYITLAIEIENLFEKTGKKLPINVDGAIAAVISEMGFPWQLGKGFFIISRTPGLIAHVYEEWMMNKPMRVINPEDAVYDGPAERKLP